MLPDLSQYRLCLPVNAAGALSFQHDAAIINPPQLLTYSSEWFHRDGAELVFKCPDGGAYSATATHARSELRDLRDFTVNDHVKDTLTLAVTRLEPGYKVILQQIHDAEEEWVKVEFLEDTLYAMITRKDGVQDLHVQLLDGLKLGDRIDLSTEFTPGGFNGNVSQHLKIAVSSGGRTGGANYTMTRSGKSAAYFKRGCYYQNNAGKYAAGDHSQYCEVRHYA